MLEAPDLVDLVVRMAPARERAGAAQALAERLGAESLLVFVRDPVLDILIPAQGFPQTVHGGPRWRSFLAQCRSTGRCHGEVDLPRETNRRAVALVYNGIAAVFLGGEPHEAGLVALERVLPMLAALLACEQQAALAISEATEARGAASRSQALADALEGARADASRLNAQLRDEDRRKDDFLAMLAHELRNPLSPLVTSIELLRHHELDAASTGRSLDIMARQIRQLTRLVEDLLDVSRVSRGRIELRPHALALDVVLRDAIEASRPVLDARGHAFHYAQAAAPLVVVADGARLAQVFTNLLLNAAKYTDPGGRIEMAVSEDNGHAVVRLSDNGVGLSAEMLPRIFDLFEQAPVSLGRAQGGLGIGLTLARSLVELHGGRVSAESAGPGKGSTFTVRLPLSTGSEASREREPSAARPAAPSERALRVLVVDDNRDAADSLGDMLRLLGHHAEVVYSGLKALQIAPDLEADLILLDIGLPELDGHELARRLRRIVRPETRLVAITGYGTPEDRRLSREAGFDEHMVKPVREDVLESITARVPARGSPSSSPGAQGLMP